MRVMRREPERRCERRQTTRAYLTFVAVDEDGPAARRSRRCAWRPRTSGAASPTRERRRAVRLRERRAMKKAVTPTTDRRSGCSPATRSCAARRRGRELIVATGADRSPLPARHRHRQRRRHARGRRLPLGAADPQGARRRRHADLRARRTTSGSSSTRARPTPLAARAGALRDHGRLRGGAAAGRSRCSSLLGPAAAARLAAVGVDAGRAGDGAAAGPRRASTPASATLWIARVRELGRRRLLAGRAAGGAGRRPRAPRRRPASPSSSPPPPRRPASPRSSPASAPEITRRLLPDGGRPRRRDRLREGLLPRARSRSCASATAATSTGASSASTSPAPAIRRRGDPLESDAKPKAGRVTSAGRLPDGRGVALAMLHISVPVGATVRIRHGDARLDAVVRAETSA